MAPSNCLELVRDGNKRGECAGLRFRCRSILCMCPTGGDPSHLLWCRLHYVQLLVQGEGNQGLRDIPRHSIGVDSILLWRN